MESDGIINNLFTDVVGACFQFDTLISLVFFGPSYYARFLFVNGPANLTLKGPGKCILPRGPMAKCHLSYARLYADDQYLNFA